MLSSLDVQLTPQKSQYYLQLLEELVSIDSRSRIPQGVERVQRLLKSEFERLGFQTELRANREHESADLLIATLPGELPYQVCFIGHADTVLGPSRVHRFQIDSDLKAIKGPGVGDNKGGVLVALKGLENYLNESTLRPTLKVVISPSEEMGSLGFHQDFFSIGQDSEIVLGFEPALLNGDLIRGRHGNRWYRIFIQGRSAHAGRFGEAAVNAAHEAAHKMVELAKLNDAEKLLKVNIGSFTGGEGHFNTICGKAELQLDIRFPCLETRDQLHQKIEQIIADSSIECALSGQRPKCFYQLEDDCPPMSRALDLEGYTELYLNSIRLIEEQSVQAGFTGGAADINYFSTGNNFCLDGLGPRAWGMHTTDEAISLTSFFTRSRALSHFLHHLGTRRVL